MKDLYALDNICKVIRRHIVVSSTAAGSGHPSSSLSSRFMDGNMGATALAVQPGMRARTR